MRSFIHDLKISVTMHSLYSFLRSSHVVNTEYLHGVNYQLNEISIATSLDVAMVTKKEME